MQTEGPYKPSLTQTLRFTLEYEAKITMEFDNSFLASCAKEITGFSHIKADTLKIISYEVNNDELDYDTIQQSKGPKEILEYPMVIEIFYNKKSSKFFLRAHNSLTWYDGVVTLHTCFNVIEFCESGHDVLAGKKVISNCLSVYPFYNSNNKYEFKLHNIINFIYRIITIIFITIITFLNPLNYINKSNFIRSPLQSRYEDSCGGRIQIRFKTKKGSKMRQVFNLAKEIKQILQLTYVAITTNFAPHGVGVGFFNSFDDHTGVESRMKHLTLPAGPPPPMDGMHVAMMYDTYFWNNYGKHNPMYKANLIGLNWDWTGCLNTFTMFTMVISVKNEVFFSLSCPAVYYEKFKHLLNSDNINNNKSDSGAFIDEAIHMKGAPALVY